MAYGVPGDAVLHSQEEYGAGNGYDSDYGNHVTRNGQGHVQYDVVGYVIRMLVVKRIFHRGIRYVYLLAHSSL
jgi:hypothetical protein